MVPGLVSVSFRKLSPEEICNLCAKAELFAVEWGGDVHVPAGDLQRAKEVKRLSAERGIRVAAYGSYYHLGSNPKDFLQNLCTAAELGAPVMRIWAGSRGSALYTEDERNVLVEEFRQEILLAEAESITLVPEFHGNTLTDAPESVSRLLKELPELRFYWQPRWDWSEEKCLSALDMVSERLVNMHVFSWQIKDGKETRLPLSAGKTLWEKALLRGKAASCALMEFVQNDDPEILLQDAKILKTWLSETE